MQIVFCDFCGQPTGDSAGFLQLDNEAKRDACQSCLAKIDQFIAAIKVELAVRRDAGITSHVGTARGRSAGEPLKIQSIGVIAFTEIVLRTYRVRAV